MNILIKERELEEFKAFCKELEEYKADGVIVQDIGAARYIAQHHPGLSLHASTNDHIHQLEGVLVLEEIGFDRIVPARELTLRNSNTCPITADWSWKPLFTGLCAFPIQANA